MSSPNPMYSREIGGRFYTINREGAIAFPSFAALLWGKKGESQDVEMLPLKDALAVVPKGYSWASLGMVRSSFKDMCSCIDATVQKIGQAPIASYHPFGNFRLSRTARYSGERAGQRISIPAQIRQEWGVGAKDRVAFVLLGNIAILAPEYAAPRTLEDAQGLVTEAWFNSPKADAFRAMAPLIPESYATWCQNVGGRIIEALRREGPAEVQNYVYPDTSQMGEILSRTIVRDLLAGAQVALADSSPERV